MGKNVSKKNEVRLKVFLLKEKKNDTKPDRKQTTGVSVKP